MATINKQIEERLQCIEARLPNGELQEIHTNVKEIKEILLDPEDGIIVRVNKNTFWRRQIDTRDIQELKSFKQNVIRALWGIYTIMLGIVAKLIFWK